MATAYRPSERRELRLATPESLSQCYRQQGHESKNALKGPAVLLGKSNDRLPMPRNNTRRRRCRRVLVRLLLEAGQGICARHQRRCRRRQEPLGRGSGGGQSGSGADWSSYLVSHESKPAEHHKRAATNAGTGEHRRDDDISAEKLEFGPICVRTH
jgi:hypothetical protein